MLSIRSKLLQLESRQKFITRSKSWLLIGQIQNYYKFTDFDISDVAKCKISLCLRLIHLMNRATTPIRNTHICKSPIKQIVTSSRVASNRHEIYHHFVMCRAHILRWCWWWWLQFEWLSVDGNEMGETEKENWKADNNSSRSQVE